MISPCRCRSTSNSSRFFNTLRSHTLGSSPLTPQRKPSGLHHSAASRKLLILSLSATSGTLGPRSILGGRIPQVICLRFHHYETYLGRVRLPPFCAKTPASYDCRPWSPQSSGAIEEAKRLPIIRRDQLFSDSIFSTAQVRGFRGIVSSAVSRSSTIS